MEPCMIVHMCQTALRVWVFGKLAWPVKLRKPGHVSVLNILAGNCQQSIRGVSRIATAIFATNTVLHSLVSPRIRQDTSAWQSLFQCLERPASGVAVRPLFYMQSDQITDSQTSFIKWMSFFIKWTLKIRTTYIHYCTYPAKIVYGVVWMPQNTQVTS